MLVPAVHSDSRPFLCTLVPLEIVRTLPEETWLRNFEQVGQLNRRTPRAIVRPSILEPLLFPVVLGVITGPQHRDQHGRPRLLAGQDLRRTAVALDRVRGGLPALVRLGVRGERWHCAHLAQYNSARPHSSLADQTPDEAYFTPLLLRVAA